MKYNKLNNRYFFLLVGLYFCSCVATEAQFLSPFAGHLNVKMQRVLDEWDEEGYYVSGTNPAYYFNNNLQHEYYFAGEFVDKDDPDLLCGDLKTFYSWGFTEDIGIFKGNRIWDGIQAFHHYFDNSFARKIVYLRDRSQGGDITYIAKNDAEFYSIIWEYKKKYFGTAIPKSIQPLPENLTPRQFTRNYCNQWWASQNKNNVPKSSGMTNAGKAVALGTFLAAVGIAANLISGSSSSSSSSSTASVPSSVYSMSNVEIVDWGTLGSLAISHAMVQLRNKNNYDVNVTVGLYQGSWSCGKIIYSDGERSDYISGVSDNYSTSIRVKANSMRKVYLRADSRGRPTHIRISSVR